jgi:pimeloyl-ACP methyl ester carboxylesterase
LSAPFRAWNIEQHARAIRAPVLLIQGEDDEYGTPKQAEAISAATGGKNRIVMLKRCGHTPHVDQRSKVERLAISFIRGLP